MTIGASYCLRPYNVESTSSRLITEVKPHLARLVLGWVTAWEYLVLQTLFLLSQILNLHFHLSSGNTCEYRSTWMGDSLGIIGVADIIFAQPNIKLTFSLIIRKHLRVWEQFIVCDHIMWKAPVLV